MNRATPSPPTVYVSDTSIHDDSPDSHSDSIAADIEECIDAILGAQVDDPELDDVIRELTGSAHMPLIDSAEPLGVSTEVEPEEQKSLRGSIDEADAAHTREFIDTLVRTLADQCEIIQRDVETAHAYEIAGEKELCRWSELLLSITTSMRVIRDDIIGAASAHRPEVDTRTITVSNSYGYSCTMDELIDTCTRRLIPLCRRVVDNLIMHTHTKSPL